MSDYRIVRHDGSWYDHGLSYRQAVEDVRALNAQLGDAKGRFRIQRQVWEDVPEPEPLPDLPTQAWCYFDPSEPDAEVWFFDLPVVDADDRRVFLDGGLRVFRGTVTEWVEVTE